jgi:hypothetical protein
MIKNTELRVGNKILNCDGEIVTVTEIREDFYFNDNKQGQYYKTSNPIPLSPEILEKVDWGGYVKFNLNSYFKIDEVGHLYYCNDYTGINIDYLHQLQNWYYLINKGEELTYKQ